MVDSFMKTGILAKLKAFLAAKGISTGAAVGIVAAGATAVAGVAAVGVIILSSRAHEHVFTNYISDGNATCTEDGTETAKCELCDTKDTKPDVDSALGHDIQTHEAQLSTCEAKGWNVYESCSRCDYTTYSEVAALGHNYIFEYDEENHRSKCTRCDDVKDTKSHTLNSGGYCECGYGCQHIAETAATCTKQAVCSKCRKPFGELAKHTLIDIPGKSPTCTESGISTGSKCSVCNTIVKEQTVLSANGHSWGSDNVTKFATCTESGIEKFGCRYCSATKTETISAKGHSYSTEWTIDTPAICVNNGSKSYHCTECDAKSNVTEIPSNGHHRYGEDNKCKDCDSDIVYTTGLEFVKVNEGRAYTLRGLGNTLDTDIYIPPIYNDLPVISIEAYAFANYERLTSIYVPRTVISIGENAFAGCTGLTSITLPFAGEKTESTPNTHFGYVFGASTYSENNSYVPSSLKIVEITGANEKSTSIYDYAFYGCKNIVTIEVLRGVGRIGKAAFKDCTGIASMILPFVGEGSGSSSIGNTYFGYIFGAESYSENNSCVPSLLRTVVITGGSSVNDFAFYGCEKITSIEIFDNITRIGNGALQNCSGLTDIILPFVGEKKDGFSNRSFKYVFGGSVPDSLRNVVITGGTIIAQSAFSGCDIISIKIPSSITSIESYAFSSCTRLRNVTFAENSNLQSIGYVAFNNCWSIRSIKIPSSVIKIDEQAFSDCDNLASITVEAENTAYHSSGNCLIETESKTLVLGCDNSVIPTDGSVTSIGNYAFDYARELESIEIPNSVTSIGESAFYGCEKLSSIFIPQNVVTIGESAFVHCSGLTEITFAEGSNLKSIGYSAFASCEKLTSFEIPQSVERIDTLAFHSCKGLTSISIPSSVTSIGDLVFDECVNLKSITVDTGNALYHSDGNCLIHTESKTLLKGLDNSVIPTDGSVTIIGENAFSYCSELDSIEIPNSVTSIEKYAFSYCYNLSNIIFAENSKLQHIGIHAFYCCVNLASIKIPSNVTNIDKLAFQNCDKLEFAIFENASNWSITTHMGPDTFDPNKPDAYFIPLTKIDVTDAKQTAKYFTGTYVSCYWCRSE